MQQNTYVRLRFILEEAEQLLSAMTEHQNWATFVREYNGWQARLRVQQDTIESIRRTLLQEQADGPNSAPGDAPSSCTSGNIQWLGYRLNWCPPF
ncbi:hypothetical protein [Deinococcus navajonensis]|uniref:Uncharacterized protein n=1 Tax=Deinococcus navajonensis TaxID=309884 RepID=A0ABV8XP51_9DEIO